ncbi:MAG TPA: CapA family protein [Proteiniclasticum sp.]|nr:CapA family protein [Proteiniclasticum sp.]
MMKHKYYAILIPFILSGCMNKPATDLLIEPLSVEAAAPLVTLSEKESPYAVEEDEVCISAVGDIMVHESQWLSQAIGPDTYDFRDNFALVKEIFISDDLSIANLETTINENRSIATYPRFNSPDALLDALSYAGFDLIGTANNHSMDTGMDGINSTIDELEERNLQYFGTHKDPDAKKYMMKTLNGMKIGLASFSTAYIHKNSVVINNIDSNGMEKHVNYMDLTNAENAFNELKIEIDSMKKEGAEFIILYLHWGNEYEKYANTYQKNLAQMLIDEGVGLILGSHPHMVQEMEFLSADNNDHEGLVVYSMGNFLSNQRNEILNMTGTEDGVISRVILKRNPENKIVIKAAQFIPTWINRTQYGEVFRYEIVPIGLDPAVSARKYDADVDSLTESLQNTLNAISSERVIQFEFIDK